MSVILAFGFENGWANIACIICAVAVAVGLVCMIPVLLILAIAMETAGSPYRRGIRREYVETPFIEPIPLDELLLAYLQTGPCSVEQLVFNLANDKHGRYHVKHVRKTLRTCARRKLVEEMGATWRLARQSVAIIGETGQPESI